MKETLEAINQMQGAVDQPKLKAIIEQHDLTLKWNQFKIKYMDGIHG